MPLNCPHKGCVHPCCSPHCVTLIIRENSIFAALRGGHAGWWPLISWALSHPALCSWVLGRPLKLLAHPQNRAPAWHPSISSFTDSSRAAHHAQHGTGWARGGPDANHPACPLLCSCAVQRKHTCRPSAPDKAFKSNPTHLF